MQVDKDIGHPLLLEQPSLHAAISSWHTDFELQEIFRKGRTQISSGFSCLVGGQHQKQTHRQKKTKSLFD